MLGTEEAREPRLRHSNMRIVWTGVDRVSICAEPSWPHMYAGM
jgi:hypothetical protein